MDNALLTQSLLSEFADLRISKLIIHKNTTSELLAGNLETQANFSDWSV